MSNSDKVIINRLDKYKVLDIIKLLLKITKDVNLKIIWNKDDTERQSLMVHLTHYKDVKYIFQNKIEVQFDKKNENQLIMNVNNGILYIERENMDFGFKLKYVIVDGEITISSIFVIENSTPVKISKEDELIEYLKSKKDTIVEREDIQEE